MKINSIAARSLGAYFVKERKKCRLSQIEVARRLKVSPQFLGHIEKGKVSCPEKMLSQLVFILKLKKTHLRKIYCNAAFVFVEKLFSQHSQKSFKIGGIK